MSRGRNSGWFRISASKAAAFTKFGRAPTTSATSTNDATIAPLEPDHPVVGHRQSPGGVARVHDEPGVVDDLLVIEGRVIGEDHHTIGVGELLVREIHRLQRRAVQVQRRDVRIDVGDLAPLLTQLHEDLDRGRLARFADLALVGHAEGGYSRAGGATAASVGILAYQIDYVVGYVS